MGRFALRHRWGGGWNGDMLHIFSSLGILEFLGKEEEKREKEKTKTHSKEPGPLCLVRGGKAGAGRAVVPYR